MPESRLTLQAAAARVAILSRWRDDDDPELREARRLLEIARIQARLIEATETIANAGEQLRALDTSR